MARKFSPTTRKVLLLFAGGLALGLAWSPRQYFRVVKGITDEWRKINRGQLGRAIKLLYRSKLISAVENKDGIITMMINDAGRKKILSYKLDELSINLPRRWDGLWRMVVFDIPEKYKLAREALRVKLRELGFYQFQKSIFVYPYECKDEVDFIVEVFQVRPYVHYVVVKEIDNGLHLKKLFGLI